MVSYGELIKWKSNIGQRVQLRGVIVEETIIELYY